MNADFNPVKMQPSRLDNLEKMVTELEKRVAELERRPTAPPAFPGTPVWNPQPYHPTWVVTTQNT